MNDRERTKRLRSLREDVAAEGERIRRYSMDPFLKEPDKPDEPDPGASLRDSLQKAWEDWFLLTRRGRALSVATPDSDLEQLVADLDRLVRRIDLVQRELISDTSYRAGVGTVSWLLATLLALVVIYFLSHGVGSLDFSTFQPWPEWGPVKYGEVAFWSAFGALCSLLFKAAHYLARRDFDRWYKPWYVATFLRAPFLSVILMLILLEFVEWYGDDTWLQAYLLEEGTKFYFIVFLSFCLGLTTDATASILRDLSEGVSDFFSCVANRIADKLGSAVRRGDE